MCEHVCDSDYVCANSEHTSDDDVSIFGSNVKQVLASFGPHRYQRWTHRISYSLYKINDIELRLRSPLEHERNRWKIVVRNFMKKNERGNGMEQKSE